MANTVRLPVLSETDIIGIIKLLSFTDIFALKLSCKYFWNILRFINANKFYEFIETNKFYEFSKYKINYYNNIILNSIITVNTQYATYNIIKPYNILHGRYRQYYKPDYIKERARYYLGKLTGTHIKYSIKSLPVYISRYEYGLRIYKVYISYSNRTIKITIYVPQKIKLYYNLYDRFRKNAKPYKCKFNEYMLSDIDYSPTKYYVRNNTLNRVCIKSYTEINRGIYEIKQLSAYKLCKCMIKYVSHRIIRRYRLYNRNIGKINKEVIYSNTGVKRKIINRGLYNNYVISYYKNNRIKCETRYVGVDTMWFNRNNKQGNTVLNYINYNIKYIITKKLYKRYGNDGKVFFILGDIVINNDVYKRLRFIK